MAHIKLGELLVRAGHLDKAALDRALDEQKKWGGRIGRILVEMSLVSEDVLLRALTKQLGLPRADLVTAAVPEEILAKIDARFAMEHRLCPERYDQKTKTLTIAMEDHLNVPAIDMIATRTATRIKTSLASGAEVDAALARLYPGNPVVAMPNRSPGQAAPGQAMFETANFVRPVEVEAPAGPVGPGQNLAMFETKDFGAAAAQIRGERPRADQNMPTFETKDFGSAAAQIRAEQAPTDPMEMFETKDFASAAAQIRAEQVKVEQKKKSTSTRELDSGDFSEAAKKVAAETPAPDQKDRMRYFSSSDFSEEAKKVREDEE